MRDQLVSSSSSDDGSDGKPASGAPPPAAVDQGINILIKSLRDIEAAAAVALNKSDAAFSVHLKKKFFDPNGSLFFLFALFMLCFVSFGSYYACDVPGAIEEHFERDLNISTSTFTLFYSVYAWPNVVLCFFGGFLVDRWFGIDWGTVVFAAVILFGQVLFTVGSFSNAVWLMLVGRFCFGMGAESFNSAINAYYYLMFSGVKNINFILGLQLSISRLGSSLSLVVTPLIYSALSGTSSHVNATTLDSANSKRSLSSLGWTNFIATLICSTTLISSFVLAYLHGKRMRHNKKNCHYQKLATTDKNNAVEAAVPATEKSSESSSSSSSAICFKDILNFPCQFWLLLVLGFAIYCVILPFASIGKLFIMRTFGVDQDVASKANSLIYFISVIGTPLVGFLADSFGYNAQWLLASCIMAVVAHVQFNYFTWISPYVGTTIMGLAYAIMVAILWPMVILILEKHQLGTGFGILTCFINLGLSAGGIITGILIDYYGYHVLENCFILIGMISVACSFLLCIVDYFKNGHLYLSQHQRELKMLSM